MSEFTRLAGIEPLYKYDLDPKVDKAKEREAARIEMARLQKEKEHQSVLDDRTKVMSGLKKPEQAGIMDVGDEPESAQGENLDMGSQGDPEYEPFANLESSLVSGILAYSPGKYVLSRENGKYHLEKKSGGSRTHKAVDAKSAYALYKRAKKKEVAPEDAFPAHVIESIQESVTPGDIWVQNFKTQKSIYFFPLRKGKNGNFQGLMYDPNFSRKAKVSSVPKINGPNSSRSLWKVETRVPMAAKEAFMDHPKYKQALEASEGVQHIAKSNAANPKRYEIVVNGRLKKTSPKPATAVVLARRQKGSVQVVDSDTGDLLYDSEISKKSRPPKKISKMQKIRLKRRETDAKLRLGKLN